MVNWLNMKESKVNICILILLACSVCQVYNAMTNKTFRCESGKYISNDYFCDGDKDCENREDESAGIGASACKRYVTSCGRGKFSCDSPKSSQCKNITVRCNTIKDCDDGADELNCGDEINVKNCTSVGKFLCYDGLRCLDVDYTCDGYCNCFDCSDENSNCSKSDTNLLRKCPNAYFATASGPQCLCDPNNNQSDTICNNIKRCVSNSCEQRCITYKSKNQCSCYEGFHEINGTKGAKCRSDAWYGNIVLYATMLKIKSLNVTSNTAFTVQEGVHNCVALTAANNYVYYATTLPSNNGSAILKSPITNLGKAETLINTDQSITSLAVDYVTNNIYFTSNDSLSVCTNNGKICKVLRCCDVKYVVLAPKSGWMFYLKTVPMYTLNSALVMRSNMDGSNETIFVDDVYRGNVTITIDEAESRLYVLEITDGYYKAKVERISFDDDFKESEKTSKLRSLTVINGDIFYIVEQKNDIYHSRVLRELRNMYDGDALYRDNSTSTTKFLFIHNSLLQRSDENPCNKSSCSGICLLRPAISSRSAFPYSYSCACDTSAQSDDNGLCSNYHVSAAKSGSSLVLVVVFGFFILGIVGVVGYFMFLKQNWYRYYSTLQRWQRNKRSSRIINDENE